VSASFARMADVTASTKRNPPAAGGKVSTPVAYLIGLSILPLMPVTEEIIERYQLKSPRLSYVTFVQGSPDVIQGDILIVSSVDYKIVGVGPWPTDNSFLELIVEKVVGV